MRPLVVALLTVLVLSGCGSDPEPEPEPTAEETAITLDRIEDEPAVPQPPQDKESEPDAAACDLAGSHSAHVTVVDDGDTVTVTWAGQPVAPADTTGFYVTVFDADGNGGQMGVKFLDGDQIAYFSDAGSGIQQNLNGQAEVQGSTVIATFPQPGFKIAKWSAAYTLAGADVGNCPSLGSYLTFPG